MKEKKLGIMTALLFLPILVYSLFFIYPIFYTVYLSLMKWNGIIFVKKAFIGWQNYKTMFHQMIVWKSMANAVVFMVVSLGVIFPISFLLALLVSKKTRVSGILRTIYYIPTLLPMAATGMMAMFLLSYDGGAINALLGYFHITPRDWLGEKDIVIWVVAFANAWMFMGSNMLIFVAGMTNVPQELVEAAVIDGANGLQRIIHVIIPCLKESFKIFLTSAIAGSIKVFDIIYVMTGGGPGMVTMVPAMLMYNEAFISSHFGYASTIGVLIILLSLIITFLLNHFLNEKEERFSFIRQRKGNA